MLLAEVERIRDPSNQGTRRDAGPHIGGGPLRIRCLSGPPAPRTEVITLGTQEPAGQPPSALGWHDRSRSVLVAIDDPQAAAAAPSGGLLDSTKPKAG